MAYRRYRRHHSSKFFNKHFGGDMNISRSSKELYNHPSQSRIAIDGISAIIFSLPFSLAGVVIILMAVNIIPVESSKVHVPRQLFALMGAIFFIAGEIVMFQGVAGLIRRSRAKRRASENPGDASGIDYAWDRAGIKGDGLSEVITNFLGWCFFALFMVPFHWMFLFSGKKTPGIVYFMIGLFDLIVMCGFGYCIYLLIRYLRYGQSFFKFSRFPFQPGGTVDGMVMMAKPLKGVTKLRMTLRFIEERFEIRGTGKNRSTQVVCYEVYNETKERTDFAQYGADIERLQIMFELPADLDLKNKIAQRPPCYWQLEIAAATPGVDYLSRFLVPVY